MLPPPSILNYPAPISMIPPLVTNHDIIISSDDDGHAANDSLALSSNDTSNSLFTEIAKSKIKIIEKNAK